MADDPRIRMQAEHLHGAAAVLMGDQGEHLISGRLPNERFAPKKERLSAKNSDGHLEPSRSRADER